MPEVQSTTNPEVYHNIEGFNLIINISIDLIFNGASSQETKTLKENFALLLLSALYCS